MNQWLLWSRFAAINLFGVAGLVLAWINGWIAVIIETDTSYICTMIFALFLVGMAATAWRIEKLTSELDCIERGEGGRLDHYRQALSGVGGSATRSLELRLFGRIAFIRQISNALVMLGLIGTVVGFVMALEGVSASGAGDASSIGGMVGNMIKGMGVALYTTLVGSVLNLWLGANFQILVTGTANLAAALIDRVGHDGPGDGAARVTPAAATIGRGPLASGEAAHV
ncbi:MotA/TolQ/ExbB proton channel family protein [Azospirillum sp.]|uniref:MotA/TolQ/ExbB proton channel family protein n=1 Tax=Azospirillum sp. TaxID=34012 RepID=UPI003D7247D2